MAHYAFLNGENIVTEVITGIDETDTDTLPEGFDSWEAWYGDFRGQTCKRTSYNTYENSHILGDTPFRGNYAGLGFSYNVDNDIFLPPKPFVSWTLDTTNAKWKAPIVNPGGHVYWDEDAYQADNTTGWKDAD